MQKGSIQTPGLILEMVGGCLVNCFYLKYLDYSQLKYLLVHTLSFL